MHACIAAPTFLAASRQSALPRSTGNAPPGGAQLVKRSLEPPKPNSKKPAGAGRPVGVNPHTGHTPPPPAVSRPVGLTPPCSQASTPVCTPPREPTPALVASGPGLAAGGAAGAGPGAGAGAGVAPQPMVQMPAQPQQPPEPPPKSAVQAASLGEAQLCVVAIMLAFQPMHHSVSGGVCLEARARVFFFACRCVAAVGLDAEVHGCYLLAQQAEAEGQCCCLLLLSCCLPWRRNSQTCSTWHTRWRGASLRQRSTLRGL